MRALEHGRADGWEDLLGRRFYRIDGVDRLPPFFMTVVGAGDAWLFISSTGGLTAGRGTPDSALFPYYTDDKVSEGAGLTGGLSLLRVPAGDGRSRLWEPFETRRPLSDAARRSLYKDVAGTTLVFEEVDEDLGLRLRVLWQLSSRFGIVRTCELANVGESTTEVEVLDGVVNVLPAGVDQHVQVRLSNLLDAYKRSEVDPATGLGMYWLSSRLTDLAEPSESLCANVVWQVGMGDAVHLASANQVAAFRRGEHLVPEVDVRGERGAYLIGCRLTLAPGESRTWSIVGDVVLDAAQVVDLRELLTRPEDLDRLLQADLRDSRADVSRIVAAADGLQRTADELATAHHFANVLFNVMRGGVPISGYEISSDDLREFVSRRSPATAARCAGILGDLPLRLTVGEALERATTSQDLDLLRLVREYLPLTFSRRHGDPSRPWNSFHIAGRDANGEPLPHYQGNWRDIFQNWEAMAWSFPEFVESMVTVFLDATTPDGYNPYRISTAGIDWEVPEPDNPWANIGYWSDHQIIYLLRLMETSIRFHPSRLRDLLDVGMFTHADVPYRLATYTATLADPRSTVTFDVEAAAAIESRVEARGADGRLVHGPAGDLVRVTLTEKLLVLLLAKLVNLVPDGGIWMNTQRPEWNDANNALVGTGLSVVTLAQVRRFIEFAQDLLTGDADLTVEAADLLESVASTLRDYRPQLDSGFDDVARRAFMDSMGAAGTHYRERVYAGFTGHHARVGADRIRELLGTAQAYVESSLRSNLREDGLYHSYNVMSLGDGSASIRRLTAMLEGQVAILSSGLLTAEESVALLRALRGSALYRADQHSYVLYPDKDLPGFLERNRFSASRGQQCELVRTLLTVGDRSLVVADGHGDLHFAAEIRNAGDVDAAVDRLRADPRFAPVVDVGRGEILEIFEEVFHHAEFTGRSGSFFAYEGLGSIYWHMVSKLLLAVQETIERAQRSGASAATVRSLIDSYEDVRTGLGYCKSAEEYGAFPTDPYSHTPAGHGARQPGMTGQVKEEVLTRFGELGLRVEDGLIAISPAQLRDTEWLTTATTFEYVDVHGADRSLAMPEDSLAFTFCQVPVLYRRGAALEVRVHLTDGGVVPAPGGRLSVALSGHVFRRSGAVRMIEATVPATRRPSCHCGGSAEVEAVEVHDLDPGGHEVLHELLAGVVGGVHLGEGAQP